MWITLGNSTNSKMCHFKHTSCRLARGAGKILSGFTLRAQMMCGYTKEIIARETEARIKFFLRPQRFFV